MGLFTVLFYSVDINVTCIRLPLDHIVITQEPLGKRAFIVLFKICSWNTMRLEFCHSNINMLDQLPEKYAIFDTVIIGHVENM